MDEARIDAWYTLVHVCRKWRNVVFDSPRRLDLRLQCIASTPVRETLDIWPPLPIVINVYSYEMLGMDNVIAALEHNDRIRTIDLFDIPTSQLENILAAMKRPFPALTCLEVGFEDETAPVVPASFLGGTAPCLQTLSLDHISFPELPTLLLSATHLVHLGLWRIPYSGYISPEAMITCLSVLTRLESLLLRFESPQYRPDRKTQRSPPTTRILLPILTDLRFKGDCEYLEDLVAQIDAPLLYNLGITFFHDLILDTPQLTQFITRTRTFKVHDEARVVFSDRHVWVTLPRTSDGALELAISCRQSDWQLWSLVQVVGLSFPQAIIPMVERLYIVEERYSRLHWQDDIESSQWLELLRPFTTVKSLYISQEFVPRIMPTFQELVGERTTEVLPVLRTLFLEELHPSRPVQAAIGRFVAARQLSMHPIVVSQFSL